LDAASNISLRHPQEVDVQKLIKINSAVAALRMREKTRFRVVLFVYISVYLFFATPTSPNFWRDFNA